jgi:predicted  nucleic acid-binding Zn-ribbon protein
MSQTRYTQEGPHSTMTIDERLDRIEHVTAALAEERRKDREEYRQLWRDTQRQINENSAAIAALTLKIADTQDTIRAESERAESAEQELRERVSALVSAIGQFIQRLPPPQ